jgi:serine kinase of HPr protein (carbohydrate metabolism regulator)
MQTVHASCIAFDGKGILLRGPSRSGKSDLAIRALAAGATLVADDRVALEREGGTIVASAPPALFGLIEIRGLGILRIEADRAAPLALVADLAAPERIERMPETRSCALLGIDLPWFALAPFEISAVAKLRLALRAALEPDCLQ